MGSREEVGSSGSIEVLSRGKLYVVATPIGNLDDITQRARLVLQTVDIVAAEDTRVCAKLLSHLGIKKKIISSREHNAKNSAEGILKLIREGKHVALTTDAGTPCVSDPGAVVVKRVREEGFPVTPIPGSCALAAALSVWGFEFENFVFEGFLPSKKTKRDSILEMVKIRQLPTIFYEAPHRIIDTVDAIELLFPETWKLTICRELTKVNEEIAVVGVHDAPAWIRENDYRSRGEFVLLLSGPPDQSDNDANFARGKRLLELLLPELSTKKSADITSQFLGLSRSDMYELALEIENKKN